MFWVIVYLFLSHLFSRRNQEHTSRNTWKDYTFCFAMMSIIDHLDCSVTI